MPEAILARVNKHPRRMFATKLQSAACYTGPPTIITDNVRSVITWIVALQAECQFAAVIQLPDGTERENAARGPGDLDPLPQTRKCTFASPSVGRAHSKLACASQRGGCRTHVAELLEFQKRYDPNVRFRTEHALQAAMLQNRGWAPCRKETDAG